MGKGLRLGVGMQSKWVLAGSGSSCKAYGVRLETRHWTGGAWDRRLASPGQDDALSGASAE